MVNIRKENIDYLRKECEIDESDINIILSSAPFSNSYLYDFYDVIYEFEIDEYELYEVRYNETIKQDVFIFKIDCVDIESAFMTQVFNIPGLDNWTDVKFAVFISLEIMEDELKYNYMLGHELAHIDFYNLPRFDDHLLQERYSIIEAYCDVKSLENITDKDTRMKSFEFMVNQFEDYPTDCYDLIREREIRVMFARLFLKGKISSETIHSYICENYLKHMFYLSDQQKKYEKIVNSAEYKSCSIGCFIKFDEYIRRILWSYYV